MRSSTRRWIGIAGFVACLVAGSAQAQTSRGPTIFAAASLKNALEEVGAAWAKDGKPAVKVSLAASNTLAKQIEQGMDLAKILGQGRLAMGNVDAVPAGKYGKAALQKLGAWDGVKDKIAQADSVRAALLLVSRGEAPLGIVYATDAAADPKVKVIGTFPEGSHPPIIYPVAVLKDATNPASGAFLDFLRGPVAGAAFRKQGFTILNKPHSGS